MKFLRGSRRALALAGVVAAGAFHSLPAQTEAAGENLALRQAVAIALRQNPQMESARHASEAAAARLDAAQSARLPKLQFGETYTHSNNPVFVFGSLLEQNRFTESNFAVESLNSPGAISNFRSSLDLSVPLFNRFRVLAGVEQGRLGRESALQMERLTEQQIRYQVIDAFFGIFVAEARKEAAAQAVQTAEAELERIGNLVEQGLLVSSDRLATQVQLAEFRQQLIRAEGESATAVAALNTALGQPVDTPLRVLGELTERRFQIPDQPALIRLATSNRPDLKLAEKNAAVARQKVRAARGDWLPDLNLFAQFGRSGQDLSGGSSDFAVGARLTFDVVDFGRPARIREAAAEWERAQSMVRRVSNRIGLETVQAYRNWLAAQQRLEVAAVAVDQALETLRIVRDRHEAGLTAITELLRAQTALLQSRFNLLGARHDYYLGYAAILLAIGGLDDVDAFAP